MLNSRYDYMLAIVPILKPKKIIEIGIAKGIRASQLIKLSKNFNTEINYVGYDVFDTKDDKFHDMVGNGKKVLSKESIYNILSQFTNNVTLNEGETKETLWGQEVVGDLVFIDGDHRVDSIKSDFRSLMNSELVIFDDYYVNGFYKNFDAKYFGCNKIIDEIDEKYYCLSPKSIDLPEIKLAFYSKNTQLIDIIKNFFAKSLP